MYNSPLQRNRRIGNLEGSRVLENTLNAATIRNHEQILDIAKPQEEGELPKATYMSNAVAYSRWREILTSYLNWMPKREQIVTPPTVADLPSDNPRPILVEFISGFVSFAKRINTPGTLAQRRNSAWICTLMKRSGRLLQENVITESWLSSPESLWLLKRSTISHAIAISAPERSQSLGIRKKTASIPNISKPNCRDMTTLEPICYKILGF